MTYENFDKLNTQKRQKILNAFFEVVSKNGYYQAPTDEICHLAEISKGALFHYFGTKENLLIFAFNYSVNILNKNINPSSAPSMDCFDFIQYITLEKLKLLDIYPYMITFMMRVINENSNLLSKHQALDLLKHYQESQIYLYQQLDFSQLKDDITKEDFIVWQTMISNGFIEMFIQAHDKTLLKQHLFNLFNSMKQHFRK